MNVANLELCRELYKLSGWKLASNGWLMYRKDGQLVTRLQLVDTEDPTTDESILCPAYDLGYLLRKLSEGIELTNRNGWMVKYNDFLPSRNQVIHADTPEDCAAQLAIELFKQGILKKEAA